MSIEEFVSLGRLDRFSLVMIRPLMLHDGRAVIAKVRGVGVKARNDVEEDFLTRFYRGERAAMEGVYRSHFSTVDGAASGLLSGADRETVIHEIFFRLINNESLRRSFKGGDLGAWLAVVARNHAIDYVRRRSREPPVGIELRENPEQTADPGRRSEARLLVERFQRELLPQDWRGVFELRLLQNLSQKEAAATLGIRRTTLAYRELRIRVLLRKFLLGGAV